MGGCTGQCYGAHLHFEIRYLGIPINPNLFIDLKNFTVWKDTVYLSRKSFQYLTDTKKTYSTATSYTNTATGTVTGTGTGVYYTIKSGDTLSKIARYYGTTVNAICLLNGITSTTILKIGRTILVK